MSESMTIIKRYLLALSAVVCLLVGAFPVFAEYTLILKNGRRITVQSYREEGGMVKFYGMGGEIGIAKDQIQSIVETVEPTGGGIDVRRIEAFPSAGSKQDQPAGAIDKEQQNQQRALEEKEYVRRLTDLTERIRTAQERYLELTRGNTSPEPTLLTNDEAIRGRMDDLNSRVKDLQTKRSGPPDPGPIKLLTPSPFAGLPPTVTELQPPPPAPTVDVSPPVYTTRERELSDLRALIGQLTMERDRLIQEMKEKNFSVPVLQ